jgi:hypothetical protein
MKKTKELAITVNRLTNTFTSRMWPKVMPLTTLTQKVKQSHNTPMEVKGVEEV